MKATYIRLTNRDVEALSKAEEEPRVVKKYKIAEEYMEYSEWWYIVPLLCGIGGASLFLPKVSWCGVILLVPGVIFGFFLIKGLMIRLVYIGNFCKGVKYGRKYQGRIRSYEIHANEDYGRHYFSKKVYRPLKPKLKYVLEVEIEGKKKIIRTPKLKYNPLSVLKSDRCTVYQYEDEFYVSDYDLRTDKTDDIVTIRRSKIVIL